MLLRSSTDILASATSRPAAPRQIPSGFRGEVLSVAPPWIPGLSGTALVEDRDSVVCARSSQRPSGVFVANDDFLFSLGATTRR